MLRQARPSAVPLLSLSRSGVYECCMRRAWPSLLVLVTLAMLLFAAADERIIERVFPLAPPVGLAADQEQFGRAEKAGYAIAESAMGLNERPLGDEGYAV